MRFFYVYGTAMITAQNICISRTASLNLVTGTNEQAAAEIENLGCPAWDRDRELVRRCADGDSQALRELVGWHQQKLYYFLRQTLGSAEDAEEVVQDVFLKVWQQADRFEGRASFTTWLYRVATNIAYDRLRRRKTQPATTALFDESGGGTVNAETEALKGLEQREQEGRLEEAMQTLRPEDRLLLHLFYGEEMAYAEIGRITGYAYPVLKVRLMRARRRLHAALGPTGDREEDA
jgi:RNA polymerase sigma-70 factor (ECF subfamily)